MTIKGLKSEYIYIKFYEIIFNHRFIVTIKRRNRGILNILDKLDVWFSTYMSNINIIISTVFLVKIYPFGQPHPIILVKLICITNSSIIDEPIYKSPVYLSIDNINIRHFIINQLSLIFLHFHSKIKILIKIHIDKVCSIRLYYTNQNSS